ncbi:unnamed protein product [Mytilus coruscus]|uniref:XRCC4 n=1 Tax=Mytilus coruscus TaxID=42192 RepID=A0A6J8DE64_MYTCO|nr:unnamed protein product [Mytilus coruscus]
MTSLKNLVTESKVESLHAVVKNGKQEFVCFTRLATHWIICITDGAEMYITELDAEELESCRELAEISSMDTYLARIRKCFLDADLSVSFVGTRATLTVGKSSGTINFDLFEAKAAEKKVELQNILFRLANTATSLEVDLEKANKTIDTLKAQKSQNIGGLMDFGPKVGTNPAKVKPKKTGMSVVNPTSKKRKAATGVVFD